MQKFSFSAKKFTGIHDLPFDAGKYSRLKHGSESVALEFGTELAEQFLASDVFQQLQPLLKGKKIVVSSAPYKFIPVASTALKDAFVSRFNPQWAQENSSVQDLKIFRGHSYNSDYGSMSQAERDRVITSDDFYIDKEFIKNKVLFCLDDVKITGAHERRLESLLESVGFEGTVVYIYFAELIGETHPRIENELNYHSVKDINDIQDIIYEDGFVINTRVTKFILNIPETEFGYFINCQTEKFRRTLLTNLVGNEYHKLEEFKNNVKCLRQTLEKTALVC